MIEHYDVSGTRCEIFSDEKATEADILTAIADWWEELKGQNKAGVIESIVWRYDHLNIEVSVFWVEKDPELDKEIIRVATEPQEMEVLPEEISTN